MRLSQAGLAWGWARVIYHEGCARCTRCTCRRWTPAWWVFRQIVLYLLLGAELDDSTGWFALLTAEHPLRTTSADGLTGTYDLGQSLSWNISGSSWPCSRVKGSFTSDSATLLRGQAASITTGEYRLCWWSFHDLKTVTSVAQSHDIKDWCVTTVMTFARCQASTRPCNYPEENLHSLGCDSTKESKTIWLFDPRRAMRNRER